MERVTVSIKSVSIPLGSLHPSSTYKIKFVAMSETDTDARFQFVTYIKHGPTTDVLHHPGRVVHMPVGVFPNEFALNTSEFNNDKLVMSQILIIEPLQPCNMEVTPPVKTNIIISDMQVELMAAQPVSQQAAQQIPLPEKVTHDNPVVFVSSWDVNCGIAIYTKGLVNSLNKLIPQCCAVHPISDRRPIGGRLVHLQNELGIMPHPPNISDADSKVIITWHTILLNMEERIAEYEKNLNVVAHIVASQESAMCINRPNVYPIPLGSTMFPIIGSDLARQILGLELENEKIGLMFGLQSPNKNYAELIQAAGNAGIHLIITGGRHDIGWKADIPCTDHVTFLDRYLSEAEVSLYALASDILLFDYVPQPHYSSSSAMHRLIAAGKPVICTDIRHFSELTDKQNCLKFKNGVELEKCIETALEPATCERLGLAALEYARETSWEQTARKHLDIYRQHIII